MRNDDTIKEFRYFHCFKRLDAKDVFVFIQRDLSFDDIEKIELIWSKDKEDL